MKIKIESFEPSTVGADALIIPLTTAQVDEKSWETGSITTEAVLSAELTRLAEQSRFTGKAGSTLAMSTVGRMRAHSIILAGLGSAPITAESVRRAFGAAATAARDGGARRVAALLPDGDGVPDAAVVAEAAVEGAVLATYRFTNYFGAARKDDPEPKEIDEFVIRDRGKGTPKAVKRGEARAGAVSLAKDLSNEPASTLNPVEMVNRAKQIADEHDLDITVLGPREMAKSGMGAITAVGKGSANEPQMIHLTYRPRKKTASDRVIGIVGKCITFDTGGYSIKTYDGMLDMKGDMSGAAAVLGAMSALRALGCPHTVHAVIAAAENMISGEAFRPGDILTAMNGVTIEVLSTDAEGRLVLADGLVYCARQGVQEMIDLATLTGAIVVALGNGTAGLFSNDDALSDRLLAAGKEAGERIWRMPLIDELGDQIKGDVGDIKNSGGRPGGAITAALFLRHFAEGLPWAHLDIAGCNRTSKATAYTPRGSTGWGVRTLLEYLTAANGAR